jgi:hypothetical protein
MSSSTEPQDDYDPASWTALEGDYAAERTATVPNTTAHTETQTPVFRGLNHRALNNYPDGVPVGTFKPDHITDPALRRLVYVILDNRGRPYLLLPNLATDCGTYVHQSQSNRKSSRGGVSFYQMQPFKDVRIIDDDDLAKFAFKHLQARGVTKTWGIATLQELRQLGKNPVQDPPMAAIGSTAATDNITCTDPLHNRGDRIDIIRLLKELTQKALEISQDIARLNELLGNEEA